MTDLLNSWEVAKAYGDTLAEFAEANDMTEPAMRSKLYRLRKKNGQPKQGQRIAPPEAPPKVKQEDKISGNERAITYVSPDVRTLDDLKAACDIDEAEWLITEHTINKWAVGANVKTGEMHWLDGSIKEGNLEYHGLQVVPLFKVMAKLVRRNPVAIHPTVVPVRFTLGDFPASETPPKDDPTQHVLFGSDMQIGYRRDLQTGRLEPLHDRAAISLFLQVAASYDWDAIVLGGDQLDGTEWTNRFVRSPEFSLTTQPAIYEIGWIIAQLRDTNPFARIVWLDGNHEQRWYETMSLHTPWAVGLKTATGGDMASLAYALGLAELGIEYVGDYPKGAFYLAPGVKFVHGDRAIKTPGASAKAMLENSTDEYTAFGHVHRRESATLTLWPSGKTVRAETFGSLCRVGGVVPPGDYENWQRGFGEIIYTPGLPVQSHSIPISDHQAYYGRLFTAVDYVPQLRADTGYEQF